MCLRYNSGVGRVTDGCGRREYRNSLDLRYVVRRGWRFGGRYGFDICRPLLSSRLARGELRGCKDTFQRIGAGVGQAGGGVLM